MKTNNLLLLLFGLLFGLFGFVFWWVRNRGSQYISDTANQTIEDAKNRFTAKDIIKSGGSVILDAVYNKAKKRVDNNNSLK